MEQNNEKNKAPFPADGMSDKSTMSTSSDDIKASAAKAADATEQVVTAPPAAPAPAPAPEPAPMPATPVPAPATPKKEEQPEEEEETPCKKKKSKTKRTKKYWKRRLRRRRRRRRVRRFFFFLLALLLGMVVAYGALFLAAYFAIGGLTIDTLQRFGIARDADQYLTENGDVDLTDMTLLELLADLRTVRGELSSYTLATLIDHYGLVLPEDVQRVMPTDLYDVPLDQLLSDQIGSAVTENLTMGYILSFMPGSMLNPRVIETISPRPLSLLTNGDFGALFADVKMGYLTGVTYDESGALVYQDPAVPTFQEVTAGLDLGDLLGAMTQNGDILKVIAENIGDAPAGPFVRGITEGAMIDDVAADMTVADLIVLNEETGRYEFSFKNLTANAVLGKTMGYTLVDGVWYSTYTDNGDATDDVRVTGLNAALADLSLGAIIDNQLSLTEVLGDLYVGDLQAGYERGDAIYGTPEDGAEAPVIGYQWLKEGTPVAKTQQALADIPLADLLEGNLDLTAALGDILVGDAAGYTLVDGVWYSTYSDDEDPANDVEVGGINAALADVSLASFINNQISLSEIFADMYLGDLQSGYERGDAIYGTEGGTEPSVVGYEWQKDGADVTEMQKALANIPLADLMEGNLDLTAALSDLLVGDAAGYERGDEIPNADPNAPKRYQFLKADTTPVAGVMLEVSNLSLSALLNGTADLEGTVKGMTIAEVMEFTEVNGVYYSHYVAENDPANVKVTGVLAAIADLTIAGLNQSTVDAISLGEVLGFVKDGDVWKDENGAPVTGVSAKLADCTVGTFSDSDALIAELRELTLAEAMGYEKGTDGVYYDSNNAPITGILAELAEKPLNTINAATIDAISLSKILGLTLKDGVWCDENGTPVSGISAKLAECTIGMLSDPDTIGTKMRELTLADAMGYQKGANGIYYDKNHQPITGILAELADKPLNTIDSAVIDGILVGRVMGYQQIESVWYESDGTTPVTGLLLAFADLKVGDLDSAQSVTSAIHKITLGDALGYTRKEDGHWYHVVDGEETLVRGLLAVLADSAVGEVDLDINTIPLGIILNYHKDQDGFWYDEENVKQTGIAALLAEETLDTLGPRLKALTIDDMMPNRTGLLASIDGTKPFSELENECQNVLHNATMGDLADAKVLSEANQTALDDLGIPGWWRGLTVDTFLSTILARVN